MVRADRRAKKETRGIKVCRGPPGNQDLRGRVDLTERRDRRAPQELQGMQECQARREMPEIKVNDSNNPFSCMFETPSINL